MTAGKFIMKLISQRNLGLFTSEADQNIRKKELLLKFILLLLVDEITQPSYDH